MAVSLWQNGTHTFSLEKKILLTRALMVRRHRTRRLGPTMEFHVRQIMPGLSTAQPNLQCTITFKCKTKQDILMCGSFRYLMSTFEFSQIQAELSILLILLNFSA